MNDQCEPVPESTTRRGSRRLRWKLGAAALGGLFTVICAYPILRPQPEPGSVMLLEGFPKPRRSFGLLSRLPPAVQSRVYRVKYGLFGPPQAVNLNASILHFDLPPQTVCSILSMRESAFTGTNGLQVWLLATNDLQVLFLHAAEFSDTQQIASPRISTAHGIRASMSVSKSISINGVQKPLGLTVDCLPYARKHSLDLTTRMTLTEAVTSLLQGGSMSTNANIIIQTNSFGPLRIQIPDGSGVFMLHESASPSASRGVFLSPSVPRKK